MIANPKRHGFNDISVVVAKRNPHLSNQWMVFGDGEPYEISNNVVRVIVVHILRTYGGSQGLYIIIVAGHIVFLNRPYGFH